MVYAKDENYLIQYLIEVVALPPLNPIPKASYYVFFHSNDLLHSPLLQRAQYGLVVKVANTFGSNPSGLRPCRFEFCQAHQIIINFKKR